MRISTTWMEQQGISSILEQQAALAQVQRQVSTGRRILSPSDDPSGSARALNLNHVTAANTQYQRNIDSGNNRLALEEQGLSAASAVLLRINTLALQANNASQNNQTRADIAVELRERLSQLVQTANSQDSNSEYLFAGNSTGTQPFIQGPTGVSYVGDNGQRHITIAAGETIAIGDSGADVFQMIPNGNGTFAVSTGSGNLGSAVVGSTSVTNAAAFVRDTYTIQFTSPTTYQVLDSGSLIVASGAYSGDNTIAFRGIQLNVSGTPVTGDSFTVTPSSTRDVFTTIAALASALETPASSPTDVATINNRVNRALEDLNQASNRLVDVRARVGSRLNVLEQQQSTNSSVGLQLQTALSGVQNVDYASAISQLNTQMTSLQAAQQAYMKVQGLSLFNYLK